jgi:hypothetical protein
LRSSSCLPFLGACCICKTCEVGTVKQHTQLGIKLRKWLRSCSSESSTTGAELQI